MCGHGHDRSSQQHAGGSRPETPRERAKGAKKKEETVEQLATLLAKQVLKNELEIRELQACVILVFIPSKGSDMAVTIKSASEEFGARFSSAFHQEQQNIVSPSVAAWIGLVRSTLSSPTLPEQVQAGLRVHRDGINTVELTEEVKLVKTRKVWDKNTVKLFLCVGPNLHSRLVFFSAAIETC